MVLQKSLFLWRHRIEVLFIASMVTFTATAYSHTSSSSVWCSSKLCNSSSLKEATHWKRANGKCLSFNWLSSKALAFMSATYALFLQPLPFLDRASLSQFSYCADQSYSTSFFFALFSATHFLYIDGNSVASLLTHLQMQAFHFLLIWVPFKSKMHHWATSHQWNAYWQSHGHFVCVFQSTSHVRLVSPLQVGQFVRALARALLCLVVHFFFQLVFCGAMVKKGEICVLKSVHYYFHHFAAGRYAVVLCEKRSMIMEMMMLGARSRSEHERTLSQHRHVHNSLIQLSNDRSSVN